MSDPHKEPAKGESHGGIGVVGIVIILLVIVFSGVIPVLTNQIGGIFQMAKLNAGPILGILAALLIWFGMKK